MPPATRCEPPGAAQREQHSAQQAVRPLSATYRPCVPLSGWEQGWAPEMEVSAV